MPARSNLVNNKSIDFAGKWEFGIRHPESPVCLDVARGSWATQQETKEKRKRRQDEAGVAILRIPAGQHETLLRDAIFF